MQVGDIFYAFYRIESGEYVLHTGIVCDMNAHWVFEVNPAELDKPKAMRSGGQAYSLTCCSTDKEEVLLAMAASMLRSNFLGVIIEDDTWLEEEDALLDLRQKVLDQCTVDEQPCDSVYHLTYDAFEPNG